MPISERFEFKHPPAEYPTPETMLYDGVQIDQLTPPQAIQALLNAGRVMHRQTTQELIYLLAERQMRFNRAWTLIIGVSSFIIGLYVGVNYM